MQRTQIYLPEELRIEIDSERRLTGDTMAGYLRKAAKEKLEKAKLEKTNLKKLAEELGSGVKKSGWAGMSKKDIIAWQRRMRKDRKIL